VVFLMILEILQANEEHAVRTIIAQIRLIFIKYILESQDG